MVKRSSTYLGYCPCVLLTKHTHCKFLEDKQNIILSGKCIIINSMNTENSYVIKKEIIIKKDKFFNPLFYDKEVINEELYNYDWLHLHHEDFTGQYGKFYRYRNQQWYKDMEKSFTSNAKKYGFILRFSLFFLYISAIFVFPQQLL